MLPQEKLLLQENETQLRKQEKLPPEGESVQLHQEKVLDKILFQIQLTPIGDLLPFSVKQQVSVLTAWVPFIGMTVIAFMLFLGWQVYKPKKETIVT